MIETAHTASADILGKKGIRRLTLSQKLSVPFSLFIGGMALFIYIYIPSVYEKQAMRGISDKASSIVSNTAFAISPAFMFGDSTAFIETIENLCQDRQIAFIVFVGPDGNITSSHRLDEAERAGFRTAHLGDRLSSDGRYYLGHTIIQGMDTPLGEIYIGLTLIEIHNDIARTRIVVTFASILFFIIGVVFVFAISTFVTKPLAHMVEIAEAITAGDFSSRATIESRDEVGHLAAAFNTMLGRLQASYLELEANNETLEERVKRRTAELENEVAVRKQSEAALRESEVFLHNSQKVAHLGSYIFDVATGQWESSHILDTIFGIGSEYNRTVEGLAAIIHPDFRTQFNTHFQTVAAMRQRFDFKCIIIRRSDGVDRWVHCLGEFETDASGRLRMLGTIQDITEGLTLERQLLQAQKLEGLGTLAGGIAHDFNNLLSMILGSAELLHLQLQGNPKVQKQLDRIVEASERGASISRQLLIFSRPEESELKPVKVESIIVELQHMLSHFLPKSIGIETRITAHNAVIMGDAGQVHQALLNLVLNAGDAMQNNGRLTFGLDVVEAAHLPKHLDRADAPLYAAISVADTGEGMSESVMAKIFDPFYTTKERGKGTGLGLAMVHGIVKHHRGFIDVASTPGHGTTFTLYFPASVADADASNVSAAAVAGTNKGTILVVDDELIIREMLTEYLEECGYTIITANNGAEGLTQFVAHRSSVDLVITDLDMPEMGGEEFFKKLTAIGSTVPVLISSGYIDGISKENLKRMGVVDVLTKPFRLGLIQKTIVSALQRERGVGT